MGIPVQSWQGINQEGEAGIESENREVGKGEKGFTYAREQQPWHGGAVPTRP